MSVEEKQRAVNTVRKEDKMPVMKWNAMCMALQILANGGVGGGQGHGHCMVENTATATAAALALRGSWPFAQWEALRWSPLKNWMPKTFMKKKKKKEDSKEKKRNIFSI